MKFVSKSANLLVVLSPGLSAQPLTGTPAKPTISVRFKDGLAEVNQQELVDLMLVHPAYNGDFISVEDQVSDPYANLRRSTEPAHIMTDVRHGAPMSRTVTGGVQGALTPELQKIVQEAAAVMAKEMLPSLLESALKSIVSGSGQKAEPVQAVKSVAKPKYTGKRRGRKPKTTTSEVKSMPEAEASNTDSSTETVVVNPLAKEDAS